MPNVLYPQLAGILPGCHAPFIGIVLLSFGMSRTTCVRAGRGWRYNGENRTAHPGQWPGYLPRIAGLRRTTRSRRHSLPMQIPRSPLFLSPLHPRLGFWFWSLFRLVDLAHFAYMSVIYYDCHWDAANERLFGSDKRRCPFLHISIITKFTSLLHHKVRHRFHITRCREAWARAMQRFFV